MNRFCCKQYPRNSQDLGLLTLSDHLSIFWTSPISSEESKRTNKNQFDLTGPELNDGISSRNNPPHRLLQQGLPVKFFNSQRKVPKDRFKNLSEIRPVTNMPFLALPTPLSSLNPPREVRRLDGSISFFNQSFRKEKNLLDLLSSMALEAKEGNVTSKAVLTLLAGLLFTLLALGTVASPASPVPL